MQDKIVIIQFSQNLIKYAIIIYIDIINYTYIGT